ncbi:GDP/UDP-N,N'-diacetylbacillosamine 2-epimerase [Clostridium vincentii]|uniref:GDP/UDP-N,N'-diacetylbacillosamine 2-epimerase n=2 Tax=Clostridium vincentii TaxID=52704 RepID=A0A2T0BG91_9CLOT|nr:GDP/UDP-N,N'-diacetylbacillosamine 2-epimerase [Clostridium vincentii]
MRKIAVVTSTRAEFGLLLNVLKKITDDDELQLQLIVTGTHLSHLYGYTIDEIKDTGLEVVQSIPMHIDADSSESAGISMGSLMICLSQTFERIRPDLLIIIGDRYEILSVASIATVMNIPIVHIAGGEITEGVIDEQIRHAVTKLAHIHFVSCNEFLNNVINMGEEEWRVFNVGALGIENVKNIEYLSAEQFEEIIKFKIDKTTLLVTMHPTTFDISANVKQIDNLIDALKFINKKTIITYPNNDLGNEYIIMKINDFAKNNKNVFVTKSLGIVKYLSVMKLCGVVVGNSSSAITEAPYLKIPVVNIGDRQKGRLFADNIIQCNYKSEEIIECINLALSNEFQKEAINAISLYGDGDCSKKIVKILKDVKINDKLLRKKLVWR